jgi:4-diphosphocytidyl-2-C-methyl-D-erythritol kinase
LAERLGSDVPFFLNPNSGLARATGRGEKLEFYDLPRPHRFVVVYPAVSLSTAEVYRNCVVSDCIESADSVIKAFCSDIHNPAEKILYNALQVPACRLAPRVGETIDCFPDRPFLQSSMTGSGSACFAWAFDPNSSVDESNNLVDDLKLRLKEEGGLIRAVTTCMAASEIQIA